MSDAKGISRRNLLSLAGMAGATVGMGLGSQLAVATQATEPAPEAEQNRREMPFGMIGNVKISRLLLGGNLISGWMHARDLKYVNSLFRAYANEEKIIETLRVADENGINTVFESGGNFIQQYNRRYGRAMQFIPHIRVELGATEAELKQHIQQQVDTGACALYVWGVAGDTLIRNGAVDQLKRAVELAKVHGLPVGVGSHSLLVPMACENHGVPCDFYVKTLHQDDYPSATPKEKRKEFMWLDNWTADWYDNMWCINPEETVEFFKTVKKPWLAFKILAAGAYLPQHGFAYALKSGADFIAVGMFDFQIAANCQLIPRLVQREQSRERPWRA